MEISIAQQLYNFDTLLDKVYHQRKGLPYAPPPGFFSRIYYIFKEQPKEIIPLDKELPDILDFAIELKKSIWKRGVINLSRNIGFIHYTIVGVDTGLMIMSDPELFDKLMAEKEKWESVPFDKDNECNIHYILLRKETCYTFDVLYKKIKELIKELSSDHYNYERRANGNAQLLTMYIDIFKKMGIDDTVLLYS